MPKSVDYLDIETTDSSESLLSRDLGFQALSRLRDMYCLEGLSDKLRDARTMPIPTWSKYLESLQGYPQEFGTQQRELVMAAQYALRLAAFHDAEQGVIWPLQTRASRKTYDTHPWEHKNERGGIKNYPATRPTGIKLFYGYPENLPAEVSQRNLQRNYGVGMENLMYKIDEGEVSAETLINGLAVIDGIYKLRRNENKFLLDYYFANREAWQSVLAEKVCGKDVRQRNFWIIRLAYRELIEKDLQSKGAFSQYFTFIADRRLYSNVQNSPNRNDLSEMFDELEKPSAVEIDSILTKLLYFSLVDLGLSKKQQAEYFLNELGSGYLDAELFFQCRDAYAECLRKEYVVRTGAHPVNESYSPIQNYEAYLLVVHTLLFEADDIMHAFNHPAGQRSGERFVYIEDLARKMQVMGIAFEYVEDVVLELYQYFQSLGLTLIRKSGSTKITQETVEFREEMNKFFRQEHRAPRAKIREQILLRLPYKEEKA